MPLFGRSPPAQDEPMLCPRDQTMLQQLTQGGVVVDRCPSCRGLWLDKTELKRVAHDSELEKLAAEVRAFREPSPFGCPRCGGACVSSFVSEVELDTCTKCHGVWLDHGELDEAKRQLDVKRAMDASGPGMRAFMGRL
jgi:Zn-finger nucleic acid-binding protein